MTIIAERVKQVATGKKQHYKNLTMFPLVDEHPHEAHYLLLEEALKSGYAKVTEVSEGGSVPELKFINDGDLPVLLLDGEELVGAKQNRIINLTILAPAKSTIVIPVSCVEQGRWRADSATFSAAKRTHYAAGRSRKAARVTESMNNSGSRRTDQGEIWEDIEAKFCRMKVSSPTGAAAAMYEQNRKNLEDYLQKFKSIDDQTGALFAINGKAVGFDLFDSPKPLKSMLPGLVQSYALDAIDNFDEKSPGKAARTKTAEKLLESCATAIVNRFPAVGEGHDLRLQGNGITGGALAVEDRIIHLCAFQLAEEEQNNHRRSGRLARASVRREYKME